MVGMEYLVTKNLDGTQWRHDTDAILPDFNLSIGYPRISVPAYNSVPEAIDI